MSKGKCKVERVLIVSKTRMYNAVCVSGLIINNTSSYISQSKGIPKCSTGYWLSNMPFNLIQKNEKPYYQIKYDIFNHYQGTLSIPYVGFANPIQHIPANTLVRVSLARWWMPSGVDEGRCYLQLSGWYV
jgi:hypothetical protein